jgi:hypothetical protein
MLDYAAVVASPRALPDGLILVFQHPVKRTLIQPNNLYSLFQSLIDAQGVARSHVF